MIAVIDGETTGTSTKHVVIDVGAVILGRNFEEVASFQSLANPGEEAILAADPRALAVNKITAEMMREAPPAAEVARKLEAFLDSHWGATIHSFNKSFDCPFFMKPPWKVEYGRWGECVMLSAMDVMERAGALIRRNNHGWKYPSLVEAAQFFKIPLPEVKHRALPDARLAAHIYAAILRHREEEVVQDEVRSIMDGGY